MPIHVGQAETEEEAGDGEALFALLAAQISRMSASEQIEVVTALTGEGWSGLRPRMRERFDEVAAAYLEGGPPE